MSLGFLKGPWLTYLEQKNFAALSGNDWCSFVAKKMTETKKLRDKTDIYYVSEILHKILKKWFRYD